MGKGWFHQSTRGLGGDRLLHLDCGGSVTGCSGRNSQNCTLKRVMLPLWKLHLNLKDEKKENGEALKNLKYYISMQTHGGAVTKLAREF